MVAWLALPIFATSPIAWPAHSSAAVAIPRLCVAASSPYQPRVPIASLTKMMTVWVVLHQMPLTFHQQGPCITVSAYDVALYRYDVASGQSNARIVLGQRICEGTLLRGLLVHSAGDYSQLLQSMISNVWFRSLPMLVLNCVMLNLAPSSTMYSGRTVRRILFVPCPALPENPSPSSHQVR